LLTSPRSILSGKKQIATTNNGCNTYYYGKRIGMIMESMHAWHGKYDEMQLIQIKRNRNLGTHIWFKLFYYSANLNVDCNRKDKAWVIYTKLNEVVKP
jgi:hypothetical protein